MRNSICNPFKFFLFYGILLWASNLDHLAHALEVDFENDSNLPLVYLNIAVRGGSVTDPPNQEGLTNFMGEMLLRGTKGKTKRQIDLLVDQLGAKTEVEIRAESLIIRGAVLSSQLEPFLALLKEIITQPEFPTDQIRKLKTEIISGIQEDLEDDTSLADNRFTRFLFQDHPYGKSPIGRTRDIQGLSRDQIRSQYQRLFRDESLLVIGSGDSSVERIKQWANSLVSSLTHKSETSLSQSPVFTPQDAPARRLLIIDKPDRTQTQIFIGQIGVRMTDKNFFPLYVGNYAFGGKSFSAILMDEIRVKRGWSYGASSSFRHGLQPRSWSLHLYPASKDTAPALAYSLQLLSNLKNKGLTQNQFDLAKTSLMNSSGFNYNTPQKRVENKLVERTLQLPPDFIQSFGTQIGNVSLAQANEALKEFIKPSNLAIAVLATPRNMKEALAKAAGVALKSVSVVQFTKE